MFKLEKMAMKWQDQLIDKELDHDLKFVTTRKWSKRKDLLKTLLKFLTIEKEKFYT